MCLALINLAEIICFSMLHTELQWLGPDPVQAFVGLEWVEVNWEGMNAALTQPSPIR